MPLYQDIADDLSSQIHNGTYQAGDRLPSLRKMATQLRVSIATVLEAYGLIEQQGLVETRPQSGYYVCQAERLLAPPPESKSSAPVQLRLGRAINEVLANSRNLDNYHFGLAIPHQELLPRQALGRATNAVIRYQQARIGSALPSPGDIDLRRQIAHRMLSTGCFVHPDQIVITNGCQEAILLSLQTVAKPGDIVAVESPCYHGFLLALESLGLQVVTIATDPELGIDLAALATAARKWKIKACICTPSFSNPTGACMSEPNKLEMLTLAKRHKFTIIEDDIFGDLDHRCGGGQNNSGASESRPKPILSFDREDRVIYCSSFSKSIAPGLRIGWVITGNRQQQIIERQMATTTGATALSQLTVSEYLKSGHFEKHLRKVTTIYQRNQQLALRQIAQHFPAGTKATQPKGGFVLWVALPQNTDAFELYQRALAQRISIVPGKLFARTGFNNYLRINYARPWDLKAEEKLARIGELATTISK